MNLRKGDLVEVIAGEERGRRGKILRVKLDKDSGHYRVFVEGLNLAKKHQRAQGTTKPGGIVDLPNALDVSNEQQHRPIEARHVPRGIACRAGPARSSRRPRGSADPG